MVGEHATSYDFLKRLPVNPFVFRTSKHTQQPTPAVSRRLLMSPAFYNPSKLQARSLLSNHQELAQEGAARPSYTYLTPPPPTPGARAEGGF